jgi:hypothetical protein
MKMKLNKEKIKKNGIVLHRAFKYYLSWPLGYGLKIYWLDPRKIKYMQAGDTNKSFDRRGRIPFYKLRQVLAGDWDYNVACISQTYLYRGIYQRFRLGLPWEDTDLNPYRMDPESPSSSTHRWLKKADPQRHFNKEAKAIENLFNSMKNYGFEEKFAKKKGLYKDIMFVNVGRGGKLIRNTGGLNRLIIAQILDLKRFPVYVHVIHPEACSIAKEYLTH